MENRALLFACIEKNIGDDLFVRTVCERYPHTTFFITSDAEYGSLAKIPNLRFDPHLKKWMRASNMGHGSAWKNAVGRLLCRCCRLRVPACRCAVNIVGNSFKNQNYQGPADARWMRERLGLAKEYFLLSTNFGPYTDPRWKQDFEEIFPQMQDVCFRDKDSFELFRQIPTVRYAPDAILSLGRQPSPKNGNTVLLSVLDCRMPERGPTLNQTGPIYETLMARCADFYVEQGLLVVLVESNAEQDHPAAERILAQCRNRQKVDVFAYDGNLEPLWQLYASAQKVIATRLHTIILSWLFDVPVVPIVYDIKVDNILRSYEFTGTRYDIHELDMVQPDTIERAFGAYSYQVPEELIRAADGQFAALDRVLQK